MRRSLRKLGWGGLLMVTGGLLVPVTGCSNWTWSQGNQARMQARPSPYIEGVPVPKGFELVSRMTEDYESGGQRTARHEYQGFGDPMQVREFYREQMPLTGWARVADQNVKGRITLRFERPSEACTVEISGNMINHTSIQVIVNPFSRNPSSEPPKRPVP